MNQEKKRKYSLLENFLFPPKKVRVQKLERTLSGKTVLITGASYGIGEELAYMIGFKNTELILVGRTEEKLIEVKKRIETAGGKASVYSLDLRDEIQLDSLIKRLTALDKGIDVFVSNAGQSIKRSIFDSLDRYHDFTRTMNLNYFAPVKLSLALIPILAKNKGHILNVSAINVLFLPPPKWAAYQASKSAFDQWFRSVSPELNSRDIATSSIYLPLVKTRMIKPTKEYDKKPAMKPEHVATILCKLLISKRRRYKQWWVFFAERGSLILRKPIEFFVDRKYKKHA